MPDTPTSSSTTGTPPPADAQDRPGIDVDGAARLAGVTASTVRTWLSRRYLARQGDGTLDPAAVWRCARDRRTADEAARLRHAASLFVADLHSA